MRKFETLIEEILGESPISSLEKKLSKDGKAMVDELWQMVEGDFEMNGDNEDPKDVAERTLEALEDDSEDWAELSDKDKKILKKMILDMAENTAANF